MIGHIRLLEAVQLQRRWLGQAVLATAVMCAVWACLAPRSDAAVFHWVANPSDAFWGTAANWDTGMVPSSSTADVVFTNSSVTTLSINDPDVVRDRSVRSIAFSGPDSFRIEIGGVFNLYSSDGIFVQPDSPGQTIDVDVRPRLSGTHDYHIVNHGSGLLDFSRGITPLNADATVVFDGSGDVRVSQFTRRFANQATNLSVVKNGAGTLTIVSGLAGAGGPTSTGAPTGTTTINQGTISINAERNLGGNPGGYFTAEGDFVPGTFDPAALTLHGGTLRATASFAIEDENRGVTVGPDGGTFEVPTAAHILTIANVIAGNGSLTKIGDGTLALSAENTYSGDTRPAEGTLLLSHAAALDNSTLDLNAGDSGTVTFGSPTAFTLGGLQGARDLNMGGKTLSIGANDQSTEYSGTLSNGVLTKVGDGVLTLSGASTYSGRTTIDTGTLRLEGGDNRINPSSQLYIEPDGILDINGQNQAFLPWSRNRQGTILLGNGTLTLHSADLWGGSTISGEGQLIKEGGGTVTYGTAGTYTGGTVINNGAIAMYSASNRLPMTGHVEVNGPGILDLSYWADTVRTQTIGTLSGNGTVRISGNTFVLGNGGGSSEFSGSIVDGLLQDPQGRTFAIGQMWKTGAGMITLGGQCTYTGPTNVAEGTLVVNGSIATSSGILVADGAALQGHGHVPAIGGGGLISPGTSAGILTAPSVDPSQGLGFAFEFGRVGSPDYANAADPVNDVLRLTELTSPFAAALGSDNAIDVYLGVTDLSWGITFRGGFYTDREEGFLDEIEGAAFNYYVLGDGDGTHEFNGQSYYALAESWPTWTIELATVPDTAAFFGGSAAGYVMQLTAVPEPGSLVLIALALACWLLRRRR